MQVSALENPEALSADIQDVHRGRHLVGKRSVGEGEVIFGHCQDPL
jgi:hypothetical protein